MPTWIVTGRVVEHSLRLRVRNCFGEDLLRADLPYVPEHPRALLMVLEGLALWAGEPLHAVISAADSVVASDEPGVSRMEKSALVRLEWVFSKPRRGRLRFHPQRPAALVDF
jgi:hypothetical protein